MSDNQQQPPEAEKPKEEPAEAQPAQAEPAEQPKAESPKAAEEKPAEEKPTEAVADKPDEASPAKAAEEEPKKETPKKATPEKEEPKEEEKKPEPEKKPADAGVKYAGGKKEEAEEEEEVKQEEDDIPKMGVNEFYPDGHIAKAIEDTAISRRNCEFYNLMGMTSTKRFNLHFLEPDVIIFAAGNKFQTFNLLSKEIKTYDGKDADGVASIAVHPKRKFFAVAEKGVQPNIYIYEYPTFKLYRILKKGTELAYAHVEFSLSGEKLVSLGQAPDYTITVWNWIEQRVILKSKASSQEVFRASFSPYNDNTLFTGGSGHIRFWKMAQTFTGLKLQGEVAKFGQLELSDTAGFYELPDGKIVSGTEQGTMVLWEGVLVKAHLVMDREKKTPLHNGMIEVILYEKEHFITAGADGNIKWWPLADIDAAEGDEIAEIAIQPAKEILICKEDGDAAHIINMVRGDGFWLIQDAKGYLWRLDCEDLQAEAIHEFHSGAITDLAVSDASNMCMTVGEDGMIQTWDYVKRRTRNPLLFRRKFNGKALCCDLIKRSDANKGRIAAVGYDSGIVRICQLTEDGIDLAFSFKAHDTPVVAIKFSPSQTSMVAVSQTGEIFFFLINGHNDLNLYEPNALVKLPEGAIVNDFKWHSDSQKILLACKNGYVYEIEKPAPDNVDNKETFLLEDWPIKAWKIKMMEFQMKKNQKKDEEEEERKRRMRLRGELKAEEEEEEEDWDPEEITKVCYMNDESGKFLCGSVGLFAGFYYQCDFEQDRPIKAYEMPKTTKISYINFNNFGDLLILAFTNGEIRLLGIEYPNRWLSIKQHDAHAGSIAGVKLSYDERFIISAGHDGLIFVHTLDKFMIQAEQKFNPIEGIEGIDFMPEDQVAEIKQRKIKEFQEENAPKLPEVDPVNDGVDEAMFALSLKIKADGEDIIDPTQYSIQQAKLRTEEDHRLKLANEKKEGVRSKIEILRRQFVQLVQKNFQEETSIQVTEEDFNIDPEFFEMLLERNASKIEETKKEVAWGIEKATVALDKLKNKFYNVLDFEKYTVKAIRTDAYVNTFRVPQMSEFLQKNIESFKSLLESEFAAKDGVDIEEDEDEEQEQTKKVETKTNTRQQAPVQYKTEADKNRAIRKIEREARKKKIERLTKKEAMNQGKNPEDIQKIEEAKRTFGMFNLKSDSDYTVPESQQVNYQKKRQQMVLLEGSITKLKADFNTKIGELRQRKQDIISRVDTLHQRLGEINGELKTPEELSLPQIDEALEYPQKFFNIADHEIDEFKDAKLKKEADELAAKKAGGRKKNKAEEAREKEAKEKAEAEARALAAEMAANDAAKEETIDHSKMRTLERKNMKMQESTLDNEMKQIMQIELEYEKQQIKDEINSLINDFDTEIKEMQGEKYRLESDLKNADMKLILLFEELIILKDMEGRDVDLAEKLRHNRHEKGQIMKDIQDITRKLRDKKKDIERIKNDEDELLKKFHSYCPEGSDKHDLLRAYYEKIKKSRKKRPEKIEKDDDDDEDDDEAEQEEEFEEDDDEDEDDAAIVSLPQEEYNVDQIEKLRDDRIQLYEEKEKINVYINDLEMQRRRMETNEKRINEELLETEIEISDFQKQKLAKLNELLMPIVLKVKQIQNLDLHQEEQTKWESIRELELNDKLEAIDAGHHDNEGGEHETDREALKNEERRKFYEEEDWRGNFLPKDLKESILFTRTQLLQLLERKREIDNERYELEKEEVESKNMAAKKKKEIKEHEKVRDEKEREYKERQMLRFGNLVDLDSLEVSGPSPAVIELTNKYNKKEKECHRAIEDHSAALAKTQRELTEKIQKNTNLLNMIRQLGETQRDLNQSLDSNQKNIFFDDDNEQKKLADQLKQGYKDKLERNAREIDILKQEINLYKRKGGHIYTKVTTNRRTQGMNEH